MQLILFFAILGGARYGARAHEVVGENLCRNITNCMQCMLNFTFVDGARYGARARSCWGDFL